MEKTRLILTRHGETDWNAEHRIQGHADKELNEKGIRQARMLAARLDGAEIPTIYSSDLSRASRTAAIISESIPKARHIITPLLRERNWGVFEGKVWMEIQNKLPPDIRNFKKHPLDYKPENGESRAHVLGRVKEFLDRLLEDHKNGSVLAVTHGGVGSLMIKHMLNMDTTSLTPFRIENCSLSILENFEKFGWIVQCINDMSHLDEDKIF